MHLPVDLICVDGRLDVLESSRSYRAIAYSCRNITFNNVMFLSPVGLEQLDVAGLISEEIQYIKIPPLNSLSQYSGFMLDECYKYVHSNHSLIIQNDGFIINPDCWDNEFLYYDYIGAPWPHHFNFVNRVGNGGFSLRSRKLMIAASENPAPIPNNKGAEDVIICNEKKFELEKLGFKFAPVELAAKFSQECIQEPKTFGFHGKHSCYKKYHMLIDNQ